MLAGDTGRGERARKLQARDDGLVWHPYAPVPAPVPPVPVESGAGARLRLVDGREVVDGMSSWWAAIHGYRHPVLDEAAHRQIDTLSHVMFGGMTHEPAVELCERLVDLAPAGLAHVFLADSGSVAMEVAIKMALQHARGTGRPERSRLLTVRGGYHGDTLGCMSVCDPVNGMHSMFADLVPTQLFAPEPTPEFGDEWSEGHLAEFDQLLDRHADEIAAVVLEPVVQGAGGMRFYAPEFLTGVRRRCDDHGLLLVADEIATGFGRSGELWGCDHADVRPDVMAVGKALTGGYLTMAATLCTSEVADGVCAAESGALMHGPTFMGNPLASAIASASVGLVAEGGWRADVSRIEARLRDGLAPVHGHEAVADVRVLGAIGVVELAEPAPMAETQALLLDRGVWLRPFGRLLYTMPPYVTDDDDVDRITAGMVDVVDSLA